MAHKAKNSPSSPSASRLPEGLLGLPEKARKLIYRRVLIVKHPIYLFQDPGSQVETFAPERPRHWLALLRTTRQLNEEASPILYGENRFFLVEETRRDSDLLFSFLNSIGARNGSLLTHLCINFPAIEGGPGTFALKESSLRDLRLLEQRCTNLKTLELFCYNVDSCGLAESDQTTSTSVVEALSQIDTQLKAIHSLEKIIARFSGKAPSSSSRESMKRLGWAVLPAYSDHW